MLTATEIDHLNQLSDELEALYKPIRFTEYNAPLNRDSEQEKLFDAHAKGKAYQPQFVYNLLPDGLERPLIDFLKRLEPHRSPWEQILFDDVLDTIHALETLRTHDPATITANSVMTHGLPTRELVEAAYHTLQHIPAAPIPTVQHDSLMSSEQAAHALRKALQRAVLTDWEVVVNPVMNARMMVRSTEQQVHVRAGTHFSPESVQRLLIHEIGTHVFRYANGVIQPLRLLRMGFAGYMMTEEGMATYNEHQHGVASIDADRRYALRVVAAYRALGASFYTVFEELLAYTTKVDAFSIVQRAKRGFEDTAAYGSHIKDKVYYEGFLTISAHLQDNPADYDLLMTGKCSLKMLPAMRQLQADDLLEAPRYLPAQLLDA